MAYTVDELYRYEERYLLHIPAEDEGELLYFTVTKAVLDAFLDWVHRTSDSGITYTVAGLDMRECAYLSTLPFDKKEGVPYRAMSRIILNAFLEYMRSQEEVDRLRKPYVRQA